MKKILFISTCIMAFSFALHAQSPCAGSVSITASDVTPCLGEMITLTATGAETYEWNNNVQNGVGFAPAASETYTVIGTDTGGCKDTVSVFVDVLPIPDVVANSSSLSICLGDSIQLTATGADSYDWLSPSIANGDIYVPTDTGANIFSVEGTGSNGCVNTSQVIVVVKAIPEAPSLSTDYVSTCLNIEYADQVVATSAEGRPIWYTDEALTDEYTTEPTLTVSNDSVSVRTFYASTYEGGCYGPVSAATVEVYALPVISAGGDINILAANNGSLNGTAPEGTITEWSPEIYLSDVSDLQASFTAHNSTEYTLTVTDGNGCVSTDQMLVNVTPILKVSNIMTPNGDGNNDVWKVYPEVILETCKVRIFDGFGRMLLETESYQNDWDGTYEGSILPDGDYYYHLDCTDVEEKGTLIIIN